MDLNVQRSDCRTSFCNFSDYIHLSFTQLPPGCQLPNYSVQAHESCYLKPSNYIWDSVFSCPLWTQIQMKCHVKEHWFWFLRRCSKCWMVQTSSAKGQPMWQTLTSERWEMGKRWANKCSFPFSLQRNVLNHDFAMLPDKVGWPVKWPTSSFSFFQKKIANMLSCIAYHNFLPHLPFLSLLMCWT